MKFLVNNQMKVESYQKGDTFYLLTGNEKYFQQIFNDAWKSENKQGDMPSMAFSDIVVDDGKMWVSCPESFFGRVARRIDFRLCNNKWIQKRQYVCDYMTETAKQIG